MNQASRVVFTSRALNEVPGFGGKMCVGGRMHKNFPVSKSTGGSELCKRPVNLGRESWMALVYTLTGCLDHMLLI